MTSQWKQVFTGDVPILLFESSTSAPLEQSLSRLSVFEDYDGAITPAADSPILSVEAGIRRVSDSPDLPIDLSDSDEDSLLTSHTSFEAFGASSASSQHGHWSNQPESVERQQGEVANVYGTPAIPDDLSDDDGTDFLEKDPQIQTPCPLPASRAAPAYLSSTRSRARTASRRAKPVERRLFQQSTSIRKLIKRPRGIEYRAKNHSWTDEQRAALCVLCRFYTKKPHQFNLILSNFCGAELDNRQVEAQLAQIRYKQSSRIASFYQAVSATPRNDPNYALLQQARSLIEDSASLTSGIQLERLPAGDVWRPQSKFRGKISFPRAVYKSLIERSSPQIGKNIPRPSGLTPVDNLQEEVDTSPFVDDNHAIDSDSSLETSTQVQSQHLEDPEPIQAVRVNVTPQITEKLAFRVWDKNSGAQYIENQGFVSSLHNMMNDPLNLLQRPFALDSGEGERAFYLLTACHTNHKGGKTGFVSLTTSLLQALAYCKGKKHPMIAVVDLQHPSLHTENKMHHASDIIRWLRRNKEADWSRFYRGSAEYMVWKDIPDIAIIMKFAVSELFSLTSRRPSCARVLDLDLLTSNHPVSFIARQLDKTNLYIDEQVARGMGRIAREFGFSRRYIPGLEYITTFVEKLVHGLYLKKGRWDIHTRSTIASSFAMSLACEEYLLQDVMAAFITGVEQGTEIMHAWKNKIRK